MTCTHLKAISKSPGPNSVVYREECTLCFDSQDGESGLNVCLECYNGGCINQGHSALHFKKTGHALVVNIKRNRLVKESDSRPKKITKLTIEEGSGGDDEYEFKIAVRCIECGDVDTDKAASFGLDKVADAVLKSMSAKRKSELKAWQEESLQTCYHTSELVQENASILGSDAAHCSACDLNENLWLCLTCGNLGCGREQFGGLPGNSHGLAHFQATKHPVAVKMGSITPEGTADIFCYEHGNEILNPELDRHLAHFGINIETQEKTVKSIAEMQLDQNLKFDFSMTTEDGKELTPLAGPGLTGIINLGNSCYMASVLQVVFSIPAFKSRYFQSSHPLQCYEFPTDCFYCQMCKVADGLLSGRYALEDKTLGITPTMFKSLIGKGHEEFSTMRQQDAQEFLQHILTTVGKKERTSGADPSNSFKFLTENRKQCLECENVKYEALDSNFLMLRVPAVPTGGEAVNGKIQYKDVSLIDCIDSYFESDLRQLSCPVDKQQTTVSFTQKFHTFPEFLVCVAARFVLGKGWVMEKLNVNINAPLNLDLESYRATGHQSGEKLFPQEEASGAGYGPQVDQESVNQLMAMGFSENRCKRALITTGNAGVEVAMNWIFEHMDDAGIDDPIPSAGGGGAQISEAELSSLMDMGFTKKAAIVAMKETNNNLERAVDWLFSHPDAGNEPESSSSAPGASSSASPDIDMLPAKYELFALISHKGTSAHCGHYVAFVKKDNVWVLFNDKKVVQVPDMTENIKQAYLYVYRRLS